MLRIRAVEKAVALIPEADAAEAIMAANAINTVHKVGVVIDTVNAKKKLKRPMPDRLAFVDVLCSVAKV